MKLPLPNMKLPKFSVANLNFPGQFEFAAVNVNVPSEFEFDVVNLNLL